ncbi:MAG: DUF5686 and carboxypeptidase regulatory-like domain-containing protein [Ferruginibacter sp.]
MKFIFIILLSFFCEETFAQYIVSGKITNSKLEPVAYASIQVKEMKFGTVSKEDGTYKLQLEEGKYDLIISIVGYKTQIISLVVNKETIQNVLLENDNSKNLNEVQVQARTKDHAEQIIKNVIHQKEKILNAGGAYSCSIYIKATQQSSGNSKVKSKKPLPDSIQKKLQAEMLNMSMAEIILKLDVSASQKIKEERTAVKKRGNAESLFYLTSTDGDFNLYNNLLKVPGVASIPLLSPISYSGLLAYKFRTVNIYHEGNKKIYTIGFHPRAMSNATLDGEVEIEDSSWVILNSRFTLPRYHTPEYDRFEVVQQYSLINDSAWMISKQEFNYFSKFGKTKSSGSSIALYSDFKLNRSFPKNYFGNEVSATAQAAYEKDSSFWDKARTVPLTDKEITFIHFKDSAFRATHTKQYLDSLDKKTNAITPKKILMEGMTFYNRAKERTIFIDAIPSLYRPINFGGPRIGYDGNLFKTYKSRKTISVMLDADYGLRNKDLKGSINVNRMYNPFNRGYFHVEAGRSFDFIFENDSYINVLKRSNVYQHDNFKIGHGLELLNGLYLNNELELAKRSSVAGYKTSANLDSSFIGRDLLTDNRAIYFPQYNAFYNSITLSYTPGQRYIREPKEKIILGSSFPTAHVTWRKGIPNVFNSVIDFDYLEFGLSQTVKLGLAGISQYTITSGSFINSKNLQLVDYKFERRGDPFLFGNPGRSFQALDSTFPVFRRFYEGHYIHEFNGAILSKIPLLKKLKLLEVAGGGFLFTQERNLHYVEAFAGVEKQVKMFRDKYKIGVYVAGSAANQFKSSIQFKLGIEKFDRKRNSWY